VPCDAPIVPTLVEYGRNAAVEVAAVASIVKLDALNSSVLNSGVLDTGVLNAFNSSST